MIKITLHHIDSVTHATRSHSKEIVRSMEPRFREDIENDLVYLKEVKRYLMCVMYEPGLLNGLEDQKT